MKKYIFLLALAPMLVGITLYLLHNIGNTKQSITSGDKFYEGLFLKKDNNPLLEEIDSNWKYLANFERAFNHISDSTPTDTASIYSDLADNKDIPDVFCELARYLEVMSSLHSNGKKINQETIDSLQSSTVYPYSSQEVTAIVKIHNNDIKGAIEILHSLLNDRECPTLIKANAQELLQIYES
ncbi:hypothetical protein wVul_1193 [Wolbachia endosymbiont of Armadillidium vulgare str. wVulC]|uniref:hypothetical protein n=1 Tax=Wolbachia endosymbiont of Armadillidium vulgare TaxID=77039 RepID=UPI0006497758|nr:hypothetical protein [Wolbachia endosymbiont of Armadillidium vulgare]KLT22259.1 hypothetical protein wVul_1193 [Wolbachia endosymbiont of Armadillidium vulgare str. wVulC]OJH30431.1 hypothetical protein Wxf_03057 [Armadillidium vulgare] [Wolbachia endosymbiont of Armadillidium vulgare]OJH32169.1 hypothetical protein Wxf_01594 [Wolbachia endosymbiont of Armadillidium vulgare]OJH33034.1 hypothetical protein Wxf_02500 [Wolbachia endosymbiont of Armadillidium vulgare]